MDDCSATTSRSLHQMVFAVRDLMQDAYPELKESADRVSKTVLSEEQRFAHTLDIGLKKLEEAIRKFQRMVRGSRASSVFRRRGFQALRHFRHAARFHAGCGT